MRPPIIPQHMMSEQLYLETWRASLIPCQKTADLPHDELPIITKLMGTHAVVKAQEQPLPAALTSFQGCCQPEREALPRPISRPRIKKTSCGL